MTKIISIGNFKGGVGKTTTALSIGVGLSLLSKRVLLIDLDPQFNLTQSTGISSQSVNIYTALINKSELPRVPISDTLHIVPSDLELIKSEVELSSQFKREYILSDLIEKIKNLYDYIIIDCPPTLGLLTINSFVASDLIFVPLEAEYLALNGYTVLKEAIKQVGLDIDKVLITKYDKRKILNRNVLESIKENIGDTLFKTIIRDNIALAEAPAVGQHIFDYQPNSNGAIDYKSLCAEIIETYEKSK